jgi:thiamine kinase-like enzyme
MPPPELLRLLREVLPGQGAVTLLRLRAGLVNETYRLARDGVCYALRLAFADGVDLGLDRKFEAQVLQVAADAGLAARPVYVDVERGVLVSAWIDGREWQPADAAAPGAAARVAALLRAVHTLPVPQPPRLMSPRAWIGHYSTALASPPDGSALHASILAQLARFERASVGAVVLCHSDLHPLNLVSQDQSLRLLDWEYAHGSEGLWDVAGWCANNDLSGAAADAFLDAYLNCPAGDAERERFRCCRLLYDYVCYLWCGLWLERRGGASAAQIAARARTLRDRLAASL